MRFIDIDCLLARFRADPAGLKECQTLSKAHRSVAVKYANDRKGYIKRNGNAKWRPLKVRLTTLIGHKCWYTEAEPTGGDLVIDHYRPKESYWFLAFDEANYRVACSYANSSHHNEEHGCLGGKGEEFPLLDPRNKAKGRNRIKNERPVILDPCNKDDCKLIAFQSDGRPVLHPDFHNDAVALQRVENSKILLNLDHPDFNSKREQIHDDIETDVKAHEDLPNGSAQREAIRDRLSRKISKTAPFSVSARQYLSAYRYFDWVVLILDKDQS